MKSVRFAALVLVTALAGATAASCGPKHPSATTAAKIEALKELRDSGVITPEEYSSQAAAFGGGAMAPTKATFPLGGGDREQHVLQDPQLGMAVARIETPKIWRFQGEVTHNGGGCNTTPDNARWTAESPDGAYATGVIGTVKYGGSDSPQLNAQAQQQQGCAVFTSPQPQDFLRAVWIPAMRPGARIEGAEPLPEGDRMLREAQQQKAQLVQMSGGRADVSVNGGRVKIAYDLNGRPVEEFVSGVNFCGKQRMQITMGPPTQVIDCTMGVTMVRAPAGQLDDFQARSDQVVRTIENPQYTARMNQVITQRGAQERQQIVRNGEATLAETRQDNANRLNGIIATSNAAIDNIHRIGGASMEAARRSSDALHESSGAFARSMGDNADFTAPNGRTFNASNQYSHTYVDQYGHVTQTNSAYPPGPGWTEVQGR